ncbi:COG3904 family protein [Halocynthiibacter styelae]|uniref:Alpha/beta hydrolase n=1 Tax=Halocynthiibacter styelae TaxID=2761955 RepID=A0A8J7LUV8_9RHOB|nr:alpha/beta hydrolase [Paenihalocynthiibacter styelae]MBI1492922.1 alpha/beta hydrolase [Paenihalocynthiibacter styelae]
MKTFLSSVAALAVLSLSACGFGAGIETVQASDAVIVTGVIDAYTEEDLREAVKSNPSASKLVLQYVPGSSDDEASLTGLSRFVRGSGLTTIVPANGMVASGGTDLLTMGAVRIIEPGACIGVHTWAAGFNVSGADLPRNAPEHELYLQFYRDMGIDEAFYWFTLEAAGPDEIHWMSDAEINRFKLSTTPLRSSVQETAEQRAARCEMR